MFALFEGVVVYGPDLELSSVLIFDQGGKKATVLLIRLHVSYELPLGLAQALEQVVEELGVAVEDLFCTLVWSATRRTDSERDDDAKTGGADFITKDISHRNFLSMNVSATTLCDGGYAMKSLRNKAY